MTQRRRITEAAVPHHSWMGIDPGTAGGITIIRNYGGVGQTSVSYMFMPESDHDLWDWMYAAVTPGHTTAFIEAVSASPQMGVTSAFTFGKGYGRLLMALTALIVPFTPVRPQTWQRALQIPPTRKPDTRDETDGKGNVRSRAAIKARLQSEHKEIIRQRAQQLMPSLDLWTHTKKQQLAIADSLLMAIYGKMTEGVREP